VENATPQVVEGEEAISKDLTTKYSSEHNQEESHAEAVVVKGLSNSNVQLTKEDIEPSADHDETLGKDICDVAKSEDTAAEIAAIGRPQVAESGEAVITRLNAGEALVQSTSLKIKEVDLVPSEGEAVQEKLASASLNTAPGADTVEVIPNPVEAKVTPATNITDSKPLKTKRRIKAADAGKSSKSKSKPRGRLKVEQSEKLPSPPVELPVQDAVVAPEAEAPADASTSVQGIEVTSEGTNLEKSLANTTESVTEAKTIVHEHVVAGGEGREPEIKHKEIVSEASDPSVEVEKAAVPNVVPEAPLVAAEDVHEQKSLEKGAQGEVGEEPSAKKHFDSSETTTADVLSPEPAISVASAEVTKFTDGNILELADTGTSVEEQAEPSSRNDKTLPKESPNLPGMFPEDKVPQEDSPVNILLEDSLAEVPQEDVTAAVNESSTGNKDDKLAEEIEEPVHETVATKALSSDLSISNEENTANEQPAEANTVPPKDTTTSTDHPAVENPSHIEVQLSPEESAAPADQVASEPLLPTSAEAGPLPADSQPPPSPTLSKKSSPKSARSSNSLRRSDHWTRPARPKNVSSNSKPEREKSPIRRATIAFSSRGIFRKSVAEYDDDDRTVEWARRIRREATEAAEEEARRERKESRRAERIREELRITKDAEERRVRHEKRRDERVKEVEALLGERRAEERKMRERADERDRNEEADRRRRRRDRERERTEAKDKEKEKEKEQTLTRDADVQKSTSSRRHRSGTTTTSSSQTHRRHRSDEERKKKDGAVQPVAEVVEKAASTEQGVEPKADKSSSTSRPRREGAEARQGKGGRSDRQDRDGDAARRSRRREERNGGRSLRREEEEEEREGKQLPPKRGLFSGWRKVLLPL